MIAKYIVASTLLTCYCIFNAYMSREQFYPAVIFLTSGKANLLVMCNFGVALLCVVYKIISKIFLGNLTNDEIQDIFDHCKIAVMETLLALTIFNRELNVTLSAMFMVLLLVKVFHWLAAMRLELVARNALLSREHHTRLNALMVFLFIVDAVFALYVIQSLLKSREPSVLLLFGFEYIILFVDIATMSVKYFIYITDHRFGGQWQNKSHYMFYIETFSDLVRLMLYLAFFTIVCIFYGMPLHLMRELFVTFYHLRERVVKFYKYRKLTANMNERFADATEEELQNNAMCVICWDNMESAKKLPCGHMYHLDCLRTSLETSQRCPQCRADINLNTTNLSHAANLPLDGGVEAINEQAQEPARQDDIHHRMTAETESKLETADIPSDVLPEILKMLSNAAASEARKHVESNTITTNVIEEDDQVVDHAFPIIIEDDDASSQLYMIGEQQTLLLEKQMRHLQKQLNDATKLYNRHMKNQKMLRSLLGVETEEKTM